MSDNRIELRRVRAEHKRSKPTDTSKLGFGRYFSDHLFTAEFDKANGWHRAILQQTHSLQLDPAALCLHYGQEVFEGLKAYRGKDDGLYVFRWRQNAERMRRSCQRLMMEPVDVELFGRAIKSLVLLDREWIPNDPACSLYIRPTVIATDPYLGVRPGAEYTFYTLAGPVGAYYPEGFNPVRIWVSDEDVRAVKGGLGEAKTGANYAASLQGQSKAAKLGYTQVLWLDAIERRWVEEVGTMNIFFRFKDEIVTPPLAGTILPGVTRDSVITLCKHWGLKVSERQISIDEVLESARSGELVEAFGTGTAAVISPVGLLAYKGQETTINGNKTGELAQRLFSFLTRLQHGEEEDVFGWVERIDRLDFEQLLRG